MKTAHQCEVVPQFLSVVFLLVVVWHHALHDRDYGIGTTLALGTALQADTVVDHLLHLASVFGQHEVLALCIVV